MEDFITVDTENAHIFLKKESYSVAAAGDSFCSNRLWPAGVTTVLLLLKDNSDR